MGAPISSLMAAARSSRRISYCCAMASIRAMRCASGVRAAGEGAVRGQHGALDIVGVAQQDGAGHVLGGRIDDVPALAAIDGGDPLAVDIKLVISAHCGLLLLVAWAYGSYAILIVYATGRKKSTHTAWIL